MISLCCQPQLHRLCRQIVVYVDEEITRRMLENESVLEIKQKAYFSNFKILLTVLKLTVGLQYVLEKLKIDNKSFEQ